MSAEFLAAQLHPLAALAVILGIFALLCGALGWSITFDKKREVSRIVHHAVDALREAEARGIESRYSLPSPLIDKMRKEYTDRGAFDPQDEFREQEGEVLRRLRREVGAEYVVEIERSSGGFHVVFTRKQR